MTMSFAQMRDVVYARAEKIMEVLTTVGVETLYDETEVEGEKYRNWSIKKGSLSLEFETDVDDVEEEACLSINLEDEFTGEYARLEYDAEEDNWAWSMSVTYRGLDIREPFRSFRPSVDPATNEEALQCLTALVSKAFHSLPAT